jgi:hypothetical protein
MIPWSHVSVCIDIALQLVGAVLVVIAVVAVPAPALHTIAQSG